MALYVGQLLAPSESITLQPRYFFPFRENMAFYAVLAHFRPFLCTLITLISNLCYFENNVRKKKRKKYNSLNFDIY